MTINNNVKFKGVTLYILSVILLGTDLECRSYKQIRTVAVHKRQRPNTEECPGWQGANLYEVKKEQYYRKQRRLLQTAIHHKSLN